MKTIGNILKETIPSGLHAIFKESGVHLTETVEDQVLYDVVAVIGFSGDYKGAVGFSAEKALVKTVYGECNTLLSDSWVAEIANQVLGRLKNALLAYGINIQIALPMVLNGIKIQVRSINGVPYQSALRSESGGICVWVDSNWNADQAFEIVSQKEHAKHEGDMLIF